MIKPKQPISIDDNSFLGFYMNQEIIHDIYGSYRLTGFTDEGVFCKRNLTGLPEDEECEFFLFKEVRIMLRKLQQDEITRHMDALRFLRYRCSKGYWVFDKKIFNQSIKK